MPPTYDDLPAARVGGPAWFQVLDRFGFPTLVALIVLGMLAIYARWAREDLATERRTFLEAIDSNTKAVDKVAEGMKKVEDGLEKNRREAEEQSHEMRLLRQALTDRKPR